MTRHRIILTLAAGLAALALSSCGDDGKPAAAAGSPENPLTATQPGEAGAAPAAASGTPAKKGEAAPKVPAGEPSSKAATPQAPGYQALLDRQTAKPQHRFTPCNLVSEREAQDIVGKPMQVPVEAPQGPTCIYRPRKGEGLIALAVQDADFARLRRQIDDLHRVDVSDRSAYCGTYGQPMLYLPLGAGRVLSINAECDVARGFAVKALPHL